MSQHTCRILTATPLGCKKATKQLVTTTQASQRTIMDMGQMQIRRAASRSASWLQTILCISLVLSLLLLCAPQESACRPQNSNNQRNFVVGTPDIGASPCPHGERLTNEGRCQRRFRLNKGHRHRHENHRRSHNSVVPAD